MLKRYDEAASEVGEAIRLAHDAPYPHFVRADAL